MAAGGLHTFSDVHGADEGELALLGADATVVVDVRAARDFGLQRFADAVTVLVWAEVHGIPGARRGEVDFAAGAFAFFVQ